MKKTILLSLFALCLFASNASAQTTATTDTASAFSIADSASFTGKYLYEGLPFEHMEVSVKDGKLAFMGGDYNGILEPIKGKKDTFDAADGAAIFTFLRNAENKIAELRIEYQGQSFVGKRENK
jgi:cytochrome c